MAFPTVIIFENHLDPAPKKLILSLMQNLENDYDTFLTEVPADCSMQEILLRAENSIKKMQQYEALSLRHLQTPLAQKWMTDQKIPNHFRWSEYSWTTLCKLFQNLVSSQKFEDFAQQLKGKNAALENKKIFDFVCKNGWVLQGVDIEKRKYDSMMSHDFANRVQSLQGAMSQRDQAMWKNLERFRQEKQGCIFLCGAMHATFLIEQIKKENKAAEYLIVIPYSDFVFEYEGDYLQFTGLSNTPYLQDCKTDAAIESTAKAIVEKVRLAKTTAVAQYSDETSQSIALDALFSAKGSLHWKAGYFMDYKVPKSSVAGDWGKKAARCGVLIQEEGEQLVVRDVNHPPIANKIMQLKCGA